MRMRSRSSAFRMPNSRNPRCTWISTSPGERFQVLTLVILYRDIEPSASIITRGSLPDRQSRMLRIVPRWRDFAASSSIPNARDVGVDVCAMTGDTSGERLKRALPLSLSYLLPTIPLPAAVVNIVKLLTITEHSRYRASIARHWGYGSRSCPDIIGPTAQHSTRAPSSSALGHRDTGRQHDVCAVLAYAGDVGLSSHTASERVSGE